MGKGSVQRMRKYMIHPLETTNINKTTTTQNALLGAKVKPQCEGETHYYTSKKYRHIVSVYKCIIEQSSN